MNNALFQITYKLKEFNNMSKQYYTVVAGDSLWGIATRFHISLATLVKLNHFSSANVTIHPGDRLVISNDTTYYPPKPNTSQPLQPNNWNEAIQHAGRELSSTQVQTILSLAIRHSILPSLFIAQQFLESHWGNSTVGQQDNNWGGIKFDSTTQGDPNITKTIGSISDDGDHYAHYNSVTDYFHDAFYTLAHTGYKVAGKADFYSAAKGLFQVGGATYNYAADPDAYIPFLTQIRQDINRHTNALDRLDAAFKSGGKLAFPAPHSEHHPAQPTSPIQSETITQHYAESGKFTANQTVSIYNAANSTSPVVNTLAPGESVTYDQVYMTTKFVYISYISYSGIRRYVPIRTMTNGQRGPLRGTII